MVEDAVVLAGLGVPAGAFVTDDDFALVVAGFGAAFLGSVVDELIRRGSEVVDTVVLLAAAVFVSLLVGILVY